MAAIVATSVILVLGVCFAIGIWIISIWVDVGFDANQVWHGKPPVHDHRTGLALRVYDARMRNELDRMDRNALRRDTNNIQIAMRDDRWRRKEKNRRPRRS